MSPAAARPGPPSLALHELEEERAVRDNPIAAHEAARDILILAIAIAERDVAPGEAPIRKRDIDERQILIVPKHRRHRHQQPGADPTGFDRDVDIHLLLEKTADIWGNDPRDDG